MRTCLVVLWSGLTIGVSAAQAQSLQDGKDIASAVARGSWQRARRAISIGPTVGVAAAIPLGDGDADVGISFGVGLARYKIDILPSVDRMTEIAKAKAMEHAKARAKDILASTGQTPTDADLEQFAAEVYDAIKAELLGHQVQTKTIENPAFAIDLEGIYYTRASDLHLRVTPGFGISKVTLGVTMAAAFADRFGWSIGPALDLRILPSKSLRSPVVDVFVRYDFALRDRDLASDTLGIGARVMLDLL